MAHELKSSDFTHVLPTPLTRTWVAIVDGFQRSWGPGSGPLVARVFHRVMALIFLCAFVSLLLQVDTLVSSRGLLPAEPLAENIRNGDYGFLERPSLFHWDPGPALLDNAIFDVLPKAGWWTTTDALLHLFLWAGIACSIAAFLGLWPRLCMLLCTLLYLSLGSVTQSFLNFQWDNMILECGFLAVFLPRHRRSFWIHFLFRLLLFKLYWESGLAKDQSYLGDWHDGSAMKLYYETAPIPTWIGWYAHNLPAWWHAFETSAALMLELLLAQFIFGPRFFKRIAFVGLTGFMFLDILTANYGFFCYMALALHLFLLEDEDLRWVGRGCRRLFRPILRLRGGRLSNDGNADPTDGSSPSVIGAFVRRARSIGACVVFGMCSTTAIAALSQSTTWTLVTVLVSPALWIGWTQGGIPRLIRRLLVFFIAIGVSLIYVLASYVGGMYAFSTGLYQLKNTDVVETLFTPYAPNQAIGDGVFETLTVGKRSIRATVREKNGSRSHLVLEHREAYRPGRMVSNAFAITLYPDRPDQPLGASVQMLASRVRANDRGQVVWETVAKSFHERVQRYRLIHTYHLFGHITQDRIEPEFQYSIDGQKWTPLRFHYKADDPATAPPFVAPHQPRVDFQLWFYGLSYQGAARNIARRAASSRTPPRRDIGRQIRHQAYRSRRHPYVTTLLDRICHDPEIVAPLFRTSLPADIQQVRIRFFSHRFTTAQERERTGHWWVREPLEEELKRDDPALARFFANVQPDSIICQDFRVR